MSEDKTWKPTEDNKSKAVTFRVIAAIAWAIAIGLQIWAIIKLKTVQEDGMTMMIVLIIGALILAVTGNLLWKKANKLDPASEKDKFKFFVQNQLGAIISVLAFLPLVIMILTNKDLDGKQKGILGGIAGAALLIAGITGVDFNSASVEQYTEQTEKVKGLMNGVDTIYWTKYGKKYHLFKDCYTINGDDTDEIFENGTTVAEALKEKAAFRKDDALCKICEKKAKKENDKMLDLNPDSENETEAEVDEAA